jgi:hypothetical protein
MLFLLNQGFQGYFLSLLNIGLLGGFITAAQQNDNFTSLVLVINPIAGAVMDTHFKQAATNSTPITGVAFFESVNADKDKSFPHRIPKFFKPFSEYACFAYLHFLNLGDNRQPVKREIKDKGYGISGRWAAFRGGRLFAAGRTREGDLCMAQFMDFRQTEVVDGIGFEEHRAALHG